MPVLQAQGIGSGLDVAGLVNQLVAAERDPVVKRLDSRQSTINGQISAWGQVTSSLSALQTALADLKSSTAFQQRSTTSSDTAVATATATTSAAYLAVSGETTFGRAAAGTFVFGGRDINRR